METPPVCSFTYRPRPGEAEVHEIRLPDEWGQQLLDDLVNQEEYLETQEDFKREFPGLAFVPDATGQCISGFLVNDSSMCLTLRYHEVSTERTDGTGNHFQCQHGICLYRHPTRLHGLILIRKTYNEQ